MTSILCRIFPVSSTWNTGTFAFQMSLECIFARKALPTAVRALEGFGACVTAAVVSLQIGQSSESGFALVAREGLFVRVGLLVGAQAL